MNAQFPNPWFSMWFQPRQTIRTILDVGFTSQEGIIAALEGITLALLLITPSYMSNLTFVTFLAVFVGSAVLGMIGVKILGFFFGGGGRLIGGQATNSELRAALTWSFIPMIWFLPVLALSRISSQPTLFLSTLPERSPTYFDVLTAILLLWTLILHLSCIKEVQKLSLANTLRSLGFGIIGLGMTLAVGTVLLIMALNL